MLWVNTNVRIGIVHTCGHVSVFCSSFCSSIRFYCSSVCASYDCISLCSSFYLPSVHLSDIPSVRLSVCMFTCTYVETNVLVYALLSSKIELIWLIPCLAWVFTGYSFHLCVFFCCCCFFSCRGSNDGIAGMCTFVCKNYVYDRQKSTHIFVSDNIVLFHKSFMTMTKGKSPGKSQTRYNFL